MSYNAPGPPLTDLGISSGLMDSTEDFFSEWTHEESNTGMTPYLVGIDNHKGPAETNPFESSFAPEGAGAALCDPSSQAPKRNLSPGADQSTEKPVNKQIKRPQLQDLNRYDSSMTQPSSFGFHSSSSITRGQSFESDSPPSGSDMGYKAGESDSDPAAASSASADSRPHAQRPALEHQVSSFDLGGEGVSSRSFQSMLQDYASNARFVQGMPKAMDLPPHLTQQQLVNQSPLTLPPGAVNDEAKSTQPSPVTSHDAQEALKQSQAPTTRSSNASQPAAKKQLPPRHTKRNSQTAAKPQESAPQSKPTSATASKPSKQAEQEHEKLDPDEMKRRQFLERNRIAACKSRQKKKEWVKQLESSADELSTANTELQKVVRSQQEEIVYLRNLLSSHDGCDCSDVSAIQQKLTGISAPTPRQMGYAAPPSSLATSSSAVCSAGTPHSPTANTPTTAATNYPSPIISVPAGPSPHNLNAMSHAMQQYTVEDAAASMAPYGQVEEATAAAAASYDYFSGSSAYPTQPFTTPDLTAELGYAQQ